MGVKLIGFHELQVKLEKNMDLSAVKSAVKKNGSAMQKKAQKEAPIDSGHLHDVIFLEITDGGMTAELNQQQTMQAIRNTAQDS